MSAIETIRARLRNHPHLRYEEAAGAITVLPESPDGFPVSFHEEGTSFIVGFGGWHEHFDSEDEALECFAFGLSDRCRLRVASRGGTEYRWIVQHLVDGGWRDESQAGLFLFPFWRRRTERFHQNGIIRNA